MLQIRDLNFRYDSDLVLEDVGFVAEPGAITCLVGPSGCGKTTLLRLAAGLLNVQQGEILIDGRCVGGPDLHVPPERRSVGLVFQEGALFPHLTVRDNVHFGVGKNKNAKRVAELITLSGLKGLETRYPHELSGGQRQRVALARALAPEPRVLLFDEPYTNLDQELTRQLRDEARRIVTELETVAVFVTHDSDDVTELADMVVALSAGRVVQAGTPRQLFDHPADASVARLFGQTQRVRAECTASGLETPFGRWPLDCLAARVAAGERVDLLLRPDGLVLEDGELEVTRLRVDGADDLVGVRGRDGTELFVRAGRPHGIDDRSRVAVRPLTGRVFPDKIANEKHSQ